MLRKVAESIVEYYEKKDRIDFLKSAKETIHISKGFEMYCDENLSIYRWEEYDWVYTPYVNNYEESEIKYATCKKCIRRHILDKAKK